jgi:hypothetical protein
MNPEAAQNEFHSSNSKISPKQRFAIAAFRNWTELFQHVQTRHAGILDIQPRGLIGLQHLWPPERRFDVYQLDELGTAGRFTLHNPVQAIFCSDLVRPPFRSGWGRGCSLTEMLEQWVAPVEAERLSGAVSQGNRSLDIGELAGLMSSDADVIFQRLVLVGHWAFVGLERGWKAREGEGERWPDSDLCVWLEACLPSLQWQEVRFFFRSLLLSMPRQWHSSITEPR